MSTEVSARQDGAAYRIELNRPDCGNLVTMEMVAALSDALHRVPQEAKLVIFAGRGADFCRGRDYKKAPESAQEGRTPTALQIREAMATPIIQVYAAIKEMTVPTLSVVQGAAFGFGCALAGACDIVLAAERARFRLPEMGRGLPPTLAMCALMDKVRWKGLGYLVYSTSEIDARTAFAFGLVSAVHADGDLDRQAAALVETVCAQRLDAVKAVKGYLAHAPAMEAHARTDYAANLLSTVMSSR
jgi:enoyl-CoA hydratase